MPASHPLTASTSHNLTELGTNLRAPSTTCMHHKIIPHFVGTYIMVDMHMYQYIYICTPISYIPCPYQCQPLPLQPITDSECRSTLGSSDFDQVLLTIGPAPLVMSSSLSAARTGLALEIRPSNPCPSGSAFQPKSSPHMRAI